MTPVHVVTGFLGAGKTTLLLDQLKKRSERCAVVVNDFGEARIDAQLLGAEVAVAEISGGCVCCTAPEALVPSVSAILKELEPDRVFIEATGLARPADIVDTLRRSELKVRVMPTVAVVDPRRMVEPPPLLLEQLDASDVIIGNARSDEGLEALQAYADKHWPPLLALHMTRDGSAPQEVFHHVRKGLTFRIPPKDTDSTDGYEAVSRVWEDTVVFGMRELKEVLKPASVERLKGFFRTDLGWYRMDIANGELSCTPGPMRSGSALDVIAEEGAEALADALDASRWVKPTQTSSVVKLQAADGWSAELSRFSLRAMPGQIADISVRIPKREGEAVELSEVLALAHPPEGTRFVLIASDGMTTEPAPVADVGSAVLVHSLDGSALPRDRGGPFRVFAPKGSSACANVKSLVRIELV